MVTPSTVAGAAAAKPSPAVPLASAPKVPEPPNTIPAPPPDVAPTAPPPPELSRQQKIAALCEQRFLRVEELPNGSTFSHRGYCTECGWQSMQHSAAEAHQMIAQHVMSHWRYVVGAVA